MGYRLVVEPFGGVARSVSMKDGDEARDVAAMLSLVRNGAEDVFRVARVEDEYMAGGVPVPDAVVTFLKQNEGARSNVVSCIKLVRSLTGAGLKEAKDAVDAIIRDAKLARGW